MAAQAIRLLYSLLESRNALLGYEGEHRPAELHQLLRAGSHGALLRSSPKIALLIHLRSPHVCALSCDCFGLLCDEIHILPAAAATAAATAASAAATAAAAASSPPATAGGVGAGAEVPAVPAATPLTATNSILPNYRVFYLVGTRWWAGAWPRRRPCATCCGARSTRCCATTWRTRAGATTRPASSSSRPSRCDRRSVRPDAGARRPHAVCRPGHADHQAAAGAAPALESADQLALLHNLGTSDLSRAVQAHRHHEEERP